MEDVSKKLEEYQSGTISEDNSTSVVPSSNKQEEPYNYDNPYGDAYFSDDAPPEKPKYPIMDMMTSLFSSTYGNTGYENLTEQALAAGFGASKYDTNFMPGKDIEHLRALDQSTWSKIGTGLTKGGITALTTAANTTVGTIYGLGSALFELAFDINGNGRSVMDTLDAGVNNNLSSWLVGIQKASEKWLPNYRTETERSEKYQKEWYKPSHWFTGNFIGDMLLKNFGFTVGAMMGGVAWTKLFNKGLSKKLAGDLMRGVAADVAGDATAAASIQRAAATVAEGTIRSANSAAFVRNVTEASKQLLKGRATVGLMGSLMGAMGEGSAEGLMAKEEFLESYTNDLTNRIQIKLERVEEEVLNSGNPEFVIHKSGIDANGNPTSVPILTEAGKAEVERRKQEISQDYHKAMAYAEEQGQRLALTTYALNIPLLTWSNTVQFGRLFNGGWTTARLNASAAVRAGVNTAGDMLYAGKKHMYLRALGTAAKSMGSEAFEEMAQGTVSSGAKKVAEKNMAEFANAGYNKEGMKAYANWFKSMVEGGGEFLGDIKNWQEGFLGAITGLVSGGVVRSYKATRQEVKDSRTAAATLNAKINSKEFQNQLKGYVRHIQSEAEMYKAVQKNDKYTWVTESDKQLINIIATFYDAGVIEDLNDFVAKYADGNVTAEEIKEMKEGSAELKTKSDKEIIEGVKKRADEMKEAIESYKKLYESFTVLAPLGSSSSYLQELAYTAAHIEQFDKRFLDVLGQVYEKLDKNKFFDVEPEKKPGRTEPITDEEKAKVATELKQKFLSILSGTLGWENTLEDAGVEKLFLTVVESSIKDEAIKAQVADLIKMSEDRKNLFTKLTLLRTVKGKAEHEKEATKPEDVTSEADKAALDEEMKDIKTVEDYIKYYFTGIDKETNYRNIAVRSKSDKAAQIAFDMIDALKQVTTQLTNAARTSSRAIVNDTVREFIYSSILTKRIHSAKNLEEFLSGDKGVYATADELLRDLASVSSVATASIDITANYDKIIEEVKEALKKIKELYEKHVGDKLKVKVDIAAEGVLVSSGVTPGSGVADAALKGSLRSSTTSAEAALAEAKKKAEASKKPLVKEHNNVSLAKGFLKKGLIKEKHYTTKVGKSKEAGISYDLILPKDIEIPYSVLEEMGLSSDELEMVLGKDNLEHNKGKALKIVGVTITNNAKTLFIYYSIEGDREIIEERSAPVHQRQVIISLSEDPVGYVPIDSNIHKAFRKVLNGIPVFAAINEIYEINLKDSGPSSTAAFPETSKDPSAAGSIAGGTSSSSSSSGTAKKSELPEGTFYVDSAVKDELDKIKDTISDDKRESYDKAVKILEEGTLSEEAGAYQLTKDAAKEFNEAIKDLFTDKSILSDYSAAEIEATEAETVTHYERVQLDTPYSIVSFAEEVKLAEDTNKDEISNSTKEEKTTGTKDFMRSAIPEVNIKDANDYRNGTKKGIEVREFVSKGVNEGFSKIFEILKRAGAFTYVANRLKVGDKIVFRRYHSNNTAFQVTVNKKEIRPIYIVAKAADGSSQIIGVLPDSGNKKDGSERYLGLEALTKQLDSELSAKENADTNGDFDYYESDTETEIIRKRPGILAFDKSEGSERALDMYSKAFPIVFIKGGEVTVVNGKSLDEYKNIDKIKQKVKDKGDGKFYILVNDGSDNVIPVRLGIEHYNTKTNNGTNERANAISDAINKIAKIVVASNKLSDSEFSDKRDEFRTAVGELSDLLNLSGLSFNLFRYKNSNRTALGINRVLPDGTTEFVSFPANRLGKNTDALNNFIVKLNLAFRANPEHIAFPSTMGQILTWNVPNARVVGADFLFPAFNANTGKFENVPKATTTTTTTTTTTGTIGKINITGGMPSTGRTGRGGRRGGTQMFGGGSRGTGRGTGRSSTTTTTTTETTEKKSSIKYSSLQELASKIKNTSQFNAHISEIVEMSFDDIMEAVGKGNTFIITEIEKVLGAQKFTRELWENTKAVDKAGLENQLKCRR